MNKFFLSLLFFCLISGCFIGAVNIGLASELVEGSWITKAPMTYARSGLGAVAVDGKIYAIGGFTRYGDRGSFVRTNECYDPVSDTWVTLAPMPTARSNFAITACQGKIYCVGGVKRGSLVVDMAASSVEVYDPVTDSWSVKTDAPFSGLQLNTFTAVVDEKIFFQMGKNMLMYDPFNDTWTQKARMDLETVVYSYYPFVENDMIIVLLKLYGDDMAVMIYDVKTDTWSNETTIKDAWLAATNELVPPNRVGFGIATINDVIYAIGGLYTIPGAGNSVQGDTLVLNEQYTPNHQPATPEPATPEPATPEPATPEPTTPKFPLYIVATVLIVSISVIITTLFHLKNKKQLQ